MIAFGVGDVLFSLIISKCPSNGLVIRNVPFLFAAVLDIACYIALLNWNITEQNAYFIYAIFFLHGCSDGIWQTLTNCKYTFINLE